MYVLYGGRFSRAIVVEMVLAEGDIAYELRPIDIVRQEHRGAAFLAINPAGMIPVLVTPEGDSLTETPAISLYLAERHSLTQLAPAVDDPMRGTFLSGLFYITDELEPALKRYFYPHRYVFRPDDESAMQEKSMAQALEVFRVIDQRLKTNGPYFLGDRFSLVDLVLAYWATDVDYTALPEPCCGVARCVDLVINRPKLRAKFDEIEAARVDYAKLQSFGRGVR